MSVLAGLLLASAPSYGAESDWAVKEAPIKFKVSLSGKPTENSAGYSILLPDGGILPAPFPLPRVMTEGGKELASYVMWQNRGSGTLVVFEDPGTDADLDIYVAPTDKLKTWTPQTGLTPSMFVCAEQGADSIEAAKNLARMGAVGPKSYFQKYGTSMSPLAMQGDVQGRANPICYYLLAYVVTKDPGKTLVALDSRNGSVQVRVDGQGLNPQRVSSKLFGNGQWMNLAKGLHRVEVFCSIGLTGTSIMGKEQWCVWTLGWRPPNATVAELGGERPKDLAAPGTSMWEGHKINPNEIVKSGSCKIREVKARDSGPIACMRLDATENFWFGDELPIFTYELNAVTAGNPEDTKYVWSFGDAARAQGPKLSWFFRGGNREVTLTASSGKKQSVSTIPFYAYSGVKSSMDSAITKENFRNACLNMIKAYPMDADPTATWNKSMWNCFYEVQEFGKGYDLQAEVLVQRWSFFKSKISPEKQSILEDYFFHWISRADPDKAMLWLKDQEKATKDEVRRNDLKVMQAEILMYQKKNLEEAKKILKPLAYGAGDVAAIATIRLGDIAFLEKNINDANKFWGIVQKGVKLTKDVIDGGSGVKWDDSVPDLDGSKKKKKKDKEPEDEGKAFRATTTVKDKVADWRKSAVMDTSMASSVITLINQGFYAEALQELHKWERNFPMSKITGDYLIQEAKFYVAIGNIKRARGMLEAYCELVDVSSYVADAAEVLLTCMMKDKETDKVLKQFCEDMKKRFEFHPLAARMDDLLRVVGAGGIKLDETRDKL
jgi:tetratricopeptide (TPR) repeat protein